MILAVKADTDFFISLNPSENFETPREKLSPKVEMGLTSFFETVLFSDKFFLKLGKITVNQTIRIVPDKKKEIKKAIRFFVLSGFRLKLSIISNIVIDYHTFSRR